MADTCRELDQYVDPPQTTFRRLQAMQCSAEVQRQNDRAEYMQFLYERSGRTCGTFSGLWQEHKAELLDNFAQHLAEEQRRVWAEQRRRQVG